MILISQCQQLAMGYFLPQESYLCHSKRMEENKLINVSLCLLSSELRMSEESTLSSLGLLCRDKIHSVLFQSNLRR